MHLLTLSPSGTVLLDRPIQKYDVNMRRARNSILLNSDCENPRNYNKKHVEMTYHSFETIPSSEIGIELSKVRYLQKRIWPLCVMIEVT